MHLETEEGDVVPCGYDQGSGCIVIKLRDFDDDDNYCSITFDGETYSIIDWDVEQYTRRTVFIWIDLGDESYSDSECDDCSTGDGSESYSDEESSYSEDEDTEEESAFEIEAPGFDFQ